MPHEAADGIRPGTRFLREADAISTPASVTANTGITVLGSGGEDSVPPRRAGCPGSMPVGRTVEPMFSSQSIAHRGGTTLVWLREGAHRSDQAPGVNGVPRTHIIPGEPVKPQAGPEEVCSARSRSQLALAEPGLNISPREGVAQ